MGKAFGILRIIAAEGGSLTASELARSMGGSVATVHRFLLTLEEEGAVSRDGAGRFHLGPTMAELGARVEGDVLLVNAAKPHLEALAEEFREAVHCVARSGNRAINAAVARPDRNLIIAHPVGEPFPLHCTSAGKLFVASMAEDQRRIFLSASPFERYTSRTITDSAFLDRELRRIRADGVSVDDEEWEEGLRSVALPLHGRDGRVIAAIAMSAPVSRFGDAQLARAGEAIKTHVDAIERSLRIENKTFPETARPRGAYPHVKRVGDFVFVSGTSARRPDDSFDGVSIGRDGSAKIDIGRQTRYTLDKIKEMLSRIGCSLHDIVDIQAFLVDMADYDRFNAAYSAYFPAEGPARNTVAVKELPHPHQALMVTAIAYHPIPDVGTA